MPLYIACSVYPNDDGTYYRQWPEDRTDLLTEADSIEAAEIKFANACIEQELWYEWMELPFDLYAVYELNPARVINLRNTGDIAPNRNT